MMTTQRQAAMQSMIEWLADERELGKEPSKIEIAGEFDLHGMHYYIFKYKKACSANGCSACAAVMSMTWILNIAAMFSAKCSLMILPRPNRRP